MRLPNLFSRRGRRAFARVIDNASPLPVESLERRTLLNATLSAPLPDVQLAPTTSSTPVDLNQYFNDPLITGGAAVINTSLGIIPLNLFKQQAPNTVDNFVEYAVNGSYNGTVIQRAVPGFLLQGGGYGEDQNHVNTIAPIQNEFSGISNTLGTITAALTTDPNTQQVDPNSATSDWFINDGNNPSLDAQKFTVFGQVVYTGMQVVDAIEALPKGIVGPIFEPNVNAGDPSDGVLPLQNYNNGSPIRTTNYVYTTSVGPVNPVAYSVVSDNTALVTGSITDTNLTLVAGSGNGVAHVTVTATDLGGNVATSTFTVQVGQTQVTLGAGNSKLVRFTDADGTAGQINFSGAGTATVSFGGPGLTSTPGKGGLTTVSGTPSSITVAVTGSGASSSLTIAGKGGNGTVDLTSITADGPMHAINGKNTALTSGSVTTGGSVLSTTLASVTDGTITLGAGAAPTVTVGKMEHASVFAAGAVKSISAGVWEAGGAIGATTIGRIAVKGVFLGIINATSVQNFSAGSITGGTWALSGALGSLTTGSIAALNAAVGSVGKLNVKSTFDSSVIRATGNISTVTVGTLSASDIFAGVASAGLPTQATDFTAESSIKFVKLKTLDNSSIAASSISSVDLGSAQPVNNGSPFGVASHHIKSLKANIGGKILKLNNVSTEDQVTAAGITSTDPRITIL